ncbi:MAG: SNF2-related protein [bacterium]
MLFQNIAKSFFNFNIRKKGHTCFINGQVFIFKITSNFIIAEVGKSYDEKYNVSITYGSNFELVETTCNCQSFTKRWNRNCEHIWAVLLKADEVLKEPYYQFNLRSLSNQTRQAPLIKQPRDWRLLVDDRITSEQDCSPFFILDKQRSFFCKKPVLKLEKRYKKANGDWGKKGRLSLSPFTHYRNCSAEKTAIDKALALLSSLLFNTTQTDLLESYDVDEVALPSGFASSILPLLIETGRFYFRNSSNQEVLISSANKEVWKIKIDFVLRISGYYKLIPSLVQGDKILGIDAPEIFFSDDPHWFIYNGEINFLADSVPFQWIVEFRSPAPITIKEKEIIDFLKELEQDLPETLDMMVLPDKFKFREVEDQCPLPELLISLEEKNVVLAHLNFIYETNTFFQNVKEDENLSSLIVNNEELRTKNQEELFSGEEGRVRVVVSSLNGKAIITDFEQRVRVKRDLAVEKKTSDELKEMGFARSLHQGFEWALSLSIAHKVFADLLKRDWSIVEKEHLRKIRSSSISYSIKTEIDWFDLEVEFDYGIEKIDFIKMKGLKSKIKSDKFIQLSDGSLGILPEEWLKKSNFILEIGEEDVCKKSLHFKRSQALLLDALVGSEPEVKIDQRFKEFKENLNNFRGIKPVNCPINFCGQLRPYQKKGLDWLNFLNELSLGGCLADDMGLGKTIQVLALLALEKERANRLPSLVIVPKSLVFNWEAEVERFLPSLKTICYTDVQRERALENLDGNYLIITTYGVLRRDFLTLQEIDFNYIILDEGQIIKNYQTQAAKAARLLKARHRLSLTGTPIENHLGELWSQFEFLNPGFLGNHKKFINRFGKKNRESEDLELLRKVIYPFMLRRTKDDVELELPPKIEQTIYCKMTDGQKRVYDQVRDYYLQSLTRMIDDKGLNNSKIKILEALLRLRQICCHPLLVKDFLNQKREERSGKFNSLQEMVPEIIEEGHKILIFSQFTKMLAIIKDWMDAQQITYQYLDGRTRDRRECVGKFQEDNNCKVFLISLKAGGLGLNLTAADYVFIYDPWWNPAVEIQAIDRAHRIGQTRKVVTYRLITKDSVEEKIQQLQEKKIEMIKAVIQKDEGILKELTKDEIVFLFS